jgi:hypothetical protein
MPGALLLPTNALGTLHLPKAPIHSGACIHFRSSAPSGMPDSRKDQIPNYDYVHIATTSREYCRRALDNP